MTEDILKFVRDNLAAKEGLKVEIVMMNDWVLPNTSLRDGSIDANLFQHKVFMGKAAKELNLNLVGLEPLFLYKQAIFSKRYKALDEIPQNATVTIANDEINKYAIVLSTWQGKENEPKIQKLNALLKRPEVKDFIDKHFEGRIVPVF